MNRRARVIGRSVGHTDAKPLIEAKQLVAET